MRITKEMFEDGGEVDVYASKKDSIRYHSLLIRKETDDQEQMVLEEDRILDDYLLVKKYPGPPKSYEMIILKGTLEEIVELANSLSGLEDYVGPEYTDDEKTEPMIAIGTRRTIHDRRQLG